MKNVIFYIAKRNGKYIQSEMNTSESRKYKFVNNIHVHLNAMIKVDLNLKTYTKYARILNACIEKNFISPS